MGYPDSAIQRSDSALALSEEHYYSHATALTHRTFLHQFRNELDQTIAWANKTHEVAEEQGFEFRIVQTMILKAWAEGLRTKQETEQQAALRQIDDALERHAGMGAAMDAPYYVTLRSDLLAHMGRLDEAIDVQERALGLNASGREFFYEAEMRRLFALLLLRKDKSMRSRATELLDQSLEIARRQGARLLELKTCISRCELADGAKSGLNEDLKQVVSAISEGRDTPEWQTANALL